MQHRVSIVIGLICSIVVSNWGSLSNLTGRTLHLAEGGYAFPPVSSIASSERGEKPP